MKKITTILFDLDGTLLGMNTDEFTDKYFKLIYLKMKTTIFDPDLVMYGMQKAVLTMLNNDGAITNEELFWNSFSKATKIERNDIENVFMDFYLNDFKNLKTCTVANPLYKDIIKTLKENNYQLIIATNPVFPIQATMQRIEWAGLDINDFKLITTYENSKFCKPNLNFYLDIINYLNLSKEEILMIGNDVDEDGVIEKLGIPCYIIEDFLINKQNKTLPLYHSNVEEFKNFINALIKTNE